MSKKSITLFILSFFMATTCFCAEKRRERLCFGRFECSEFPTIGTEHAFVVGVSGLRFSDFGVSGEYPRTPKFTHAGIVDVEKCNSTEVDNYMCEQIVNINQLFFCGWGQRAGYRDEYELYEELVRNPQILERYPTVYDYVFQKSGLENYRLPKYQTMFRMVFNDDESLMQRKTMRQVERYLRSLNCLVYLQIDYGEYANRRLKDRGHALTMYGFTYDKSIPENSPERYTGVIVADSDNDKNVAKSKDAPNSITIVPVTWDKEKRIYVIFIRRIGYIRFFFGLRGK